MCNAYRHPAGCQCGFGPPYPTVGVTIRKLISSGNMRSPKVAYLDLSFPLPKTNFFHLVDETGKGRLLKTTTEALQHLADKRFGKGNIKVTTTHVKKGSIEIGVALFAVAGAAYMFFKDYEALRNGVMLFAKDISYAPRKLYQVVKKKYLNEERRALKKVNREQKKGE